MDDAPDDDEEEVVELICTVCCGCCCVMGIDVGVVGLGSGEEICGIPEVLP